MTLLDWFRSLFSSPQPSPSKPVIGRAPSASPRALGGGRVSVDLTDSVLTGSWMIVPPADYESHWRTFNLDAATLDRMAPARLIEMLADLSPEISRAVWDFQRLCNPGWECKAMLMASDDPDERAQQALDAFLTELRTLYGAEDVVWGRLFMGAYLRGAFAAEMVLDRRGRLPIDFATPDPYSIRFRKRKDDERGVVWQAGQWQGADFVPLDTPTFRYVPVDPAPGVPYGRPLAAPALFTSIFLLGLLHDLRRVIQQQGYPRLDIGLAFEQLLAQWQADPGDHESLNAFIQAAVTAVEDAYGALEPDDAYIHIDGITVNRPVGAVDASSLSGIDGVIDKLELMATRALKSMPLLMGITESTTETNANRLWEIHVAGIKSLQHLAENMIEYLLTLALQAQGIQARVEFRFAELRAAELLRDAQAEQMQIGNWKAKFDHGWVSQDEASEAVTGHPADVPEPRAAAVAPEMIEDDNDGSEALNQGSDRAMRIQRRVKLIPDGADEPLTPVPNTVDISDADADLAIRDWNRLMPDYVNLLDATVINADTEGEERSGLVIDGWLDTHGVWQKFHNRATDDDPVWVWDARAKRYRGSDGRFINQRKMTELRDQFVEAKGNVGGRLAGRLASGDMSLQEFELAFRWEIKSTFVDQYVLGKGGRNAMDAKAWGTVGALVKTQYQYAHRFAQDIAAGKLSQAAIASRAGLYFDSSVQAFERGRTASYGPLELPQYPADGNQNCKSNCKCSWSIEEDETEWRCTWRSSSKESCATCQANAANWSPLVVQKTGRSRADVERMLEGVINGHK